MMCDEWHFNNFIECPISRDEINGIENETSKLTYNIEIKE